MRRILSLILFFVILLLCGCESAGHCESSQSLSYFDGAAIKNAVSEIDESLGDTENTEMRAVWFSYIDLDFSSCDDEAFKAKINKMFTYVKSLGMNTVICQVRANSDSAYNSAYFPRSAAYSNISFDPLEYMCSAAKSLGLKIHAWINPYRVTAAHNNPEKLADGCPAKEWLTDNDEENDKYILETDNGIYYNPAESEVKKLILNGVEEVVSNYDVDGIQFDDYFYPETDNKTDAKSYNAYLKECKTPLSREEWRRTNISTTVADVYKLVHKHKNVVFGISPSAHISDDGTDENYTKLYADIGLWLKGGYIDYIAPQLYFGYNYPKEEYRFRSLLEKWCSLPRSNEVALYIGLAPYKTGTSDAESDEWQNNTDIVARQIKDIRTKSEVNGFMLYSYKYLTDISPTYSQQTNEIKKAVKGND